LTVVKDRPRWRYLHLATHGYFEPPPTQAKRAARGPFFRFDRELGERTYVRNPMLLCGVALAGANESYNRYEKSCSL
jgi:hypothetical protein